MVAKEWAKLLRSKPETDTEDTGKEGMEGVDETRKKAIEVGKENEVSNDEGTGSPKAKKLSR